MIFNKKHYGAIAETLKSQLPWANTEHTLVFGGKYVDFLNTVDKFADMFKADNPRFDREKFIAACGVEKD